MHRNRENWWDVKRGATTWRMSSGQGEGGTGGDGGAGGGGGGNGGSGDGGGSGSGEGEGTGSGSERKLTQAEVTRIMTREKQQGHTAGRAAVLKELGIEDPKEAARLIEAAKKAENDALSETERARKEATEAAARAKTAEQETALERVHLKAERKLLASGLQLDPKDEEKAERQLARAVKLLDLDHEADPEKIKQAVTELKEEMPNLFATTDGDEEEEKETSRNGDRTRRDPGRPPRSSGPKGTSKERAAARLAERHPQTVKK